MPTITAPVSQPAFAPQGDFKAALSLAALLQRVDASPQDIGAAQYRQLALRVGKLLHELPPSEPLQQLLQRFPAAAMLYENGRYSQAGLCRSPLEASLQSEQRARAAINKARGLV